MLVGFSLLFVFFLLLGIQKRAEAPSSHSILDTVPISEGALDDISTSDDSPQKSAILSIGQSVFSVELAVTEEERQLGLGGRKVIGSDAGMLFLFPGADFHGIWMKGMQFPLDIIWLASPPAKGGEQNLSETFVVVDMKENVLPETYPTVFLPTKKASYVLEIGAGKARTSGITIGSVFTLKK